MAKSRFTPPSSTAAREYAARMGFAGGNGSPKAETNSEHLARIETLLEHVQESLDTQFKRIADMQAAIDRMKAEQHR